MCCFGGDRRISAALKLKFAILDLETCVWVNILCNSSDTSQGKPRMAKAAEF